MTIPPEIRKKAKAEDFKQWPALYEVACLHGVDPVCTLLESYHNGLAKKKIKR